MKIINGEITSISYITATTISGSFIGDGSGLTGITAGPSVSASYASTASYVDGANIATDSTHRFITDTELTKLSGIASGAEVNVNADWNSVSGDSEILNKPTILTQQIIEGLI